MSKTKISLNGKTIFLTGCAGFIGAALAIELLKRYDSIHIVGIDSRTDYYDVNLKDRRLSQIETEAVNHESSSFTFILGDIADKATIDELFSTYKPSLVVNLAAQAGVRYSIDHPDCYIQSNIIGFYNILEACRHSYDGGATGVEHLV